MGEGIITINAKCIYDKWFDSNKILSLPFCYLNVKLIRNFSSPLKLIMKTMTNYKIYYQT